jgi:hypothetical protein
MRNMNLGINKSIINTADAAIQVDEKDALGAIDNEGNIFVS